MKMCRDQPHSVASPGLRFTPKGVFIRRYQDSCLRLIHDTHSVGLLGFSLVPPALFINENGALILQSGRLTPQT